MLVECRSQQGLRRSAHQSDGFGTAEPCDVRIPDEYLDAENRCDRVNELFELATGELGAKRERERL